MRDLRVKHRVVVLVFVAALAVTGLTLLTPGRDAAQPMNECVHAPAIASLETCVKHAAEQGFITNEGVTRGLLAKLEAAEKAQEHGHTPQAIYLLRAFIHEVQAQAGKHIDPEHAQHLEMHVQLVIQALKQP